MNNGRSFYMKCKEMFRAIYVVLRVLPQEWCNLDSDYVFHKRI
jgi:hypothetical protein